MSSSSRSLTLCTTNFRKPAATQQTQSVAWPITRAWAVTTADTIARQDTGQDNRKHQCQHSELLLRMGLPLGKRCLCFLFVPYPMLGMIMPHPLNFRRTRESIPLGRLHDSCGPQAVVASALKQVPITSLQAASARVAAHAAKTAPHRNGNVGVRLMALELALVLVHHLHLLQGSHHPAAIRSR